MSLEIFVMFNGNCRDALAFYAKAFKTKPQQIMTYDEMPKGPEGASCPGGPLPAEAGKLIAYSSLQVGKQSLMCSDVPPGSPFTVGNNVFITYSSGDLAEIRRLFAALGEGGKVHMELQKTFYSELFGMLIDRFGVNWQLIHVAEAIK